MHQGSQGEHYKTADKDQTMPNARASGERLTPKGEGSLRATRKMALHKP